MKIWLIVAAISILYTLQKLRNEEINSAQLAPVSHLLPPRMGDIAAGCCDSIKRHHGAQWVALQGRQVKKKGINTEKNVQEAYLILVG